MGKIKNSSQRNSSQRNSSLRKSLALYVAVFAVLALMLSVVTAALCDVKVNDIYSRYPSNGEKCYLTNEQGERIGTPVYISRAPIAYTEHDDHMITLLELLPIAAAPVYSVLCIISSALLFYKNKLKTPLTELMAASEKISHSDLDFSVRYDSNDELGKLCRSFEIMRGALAENFSEMWRQVEQRKQLNAAFAHDLRTPLTVLKGYDEMLKASGDAKISEIACTMEKHILRMESYINSMSRLRRLEDTQPECKDVFLQPFLQSLCESAKIVCVQNGKALQAQSSVTASHLSIDAEFVSQVSSNLIANAARYARSTVTLFFTLCGNVLQLCVSDDGKGFGENILNKAADPYFTEETEHSEHFGLGLYICRLLCENHGGCLRIENIPSGAKVTASFKAEPLQVKQQ